MSDLVKSILNKNYDEARSLFEEKMLNTVGKKKVENKKVVGSKLEQVTMTRKAFDGNAGARAEKLYRDVIEEKYGKGYVSAASKIEKAMKARGVEPNSSDKYRKEMERLDAQYKELQAKDKKLDEQDANIVSAQGKPVYRTVVNPVVQEPFQNLINYVDKRDYKLQKSNDSYPLQGKMIRQIKGTDIPSTHSFGSAIDLNPKQNPVTTGSKRITDMPQDVVDMAKSQGLGWGGDWKSKFDPMHFGAKGSMKKSGDIGGERGTYRIDDSGRIKQDPNLVKALKNTENKAAMKSAEYTGSDPTTQNFNAKGIAMAKASGKKGADLPLEIGRKMSQSEIATRASQSKGLSGPKAYNPGYNPPDLPKSVSTPKATTPSTPKISKTRERFDAAYAEAKRNKVKQFTFDGRPIAVNEETELDEARINIIKARIRGGKVQRRKKVSNVPGYTLRSGGLKRMSASERRNRRLGQRRGKIKRRMKLARTLVKRQRSLRKRQSLGLK